MQPETCDGLAKLIRSNFALLTDDTMCNVQSNDDLAASLPPFYLTLHGQSFDLR